MTSGYNASNATETTPLLKTQSILKRSRSSNSTLSLFSRRRLVVKRLPPKSDSDIPANRGTGVASIASLSTCHENRSATSLSHTASVDTDSGPIDRCISQRRAGSLTKLVEKASLTLENHGSVARDHLASERTFLAYVRTSLALTSAGVALVQLYSIAAANGIFHPGHRMHKYIRPLGALTIGLGISVMIIGITRYFAVQQALTKGYFPVSRIATAFMAVSLITLIIITFSILLAGKLEPKGV